MDLVRNMDEPKEDGSKDTIFNAVIDDLDISKYKDLVNNKYNHFNYELDDFQIRSMYRIEQNECVFVSAPTSSGKTAIAEYAISYCKSRGKIAIYTSPLKALSNQKFRNFSKKYGGDVGILTGDITLKKESSILVMTTEILRSMLYKNDDFLENVGYVIFDEFHYILDKERGNAWEESIIHMLPHISMVFLSATIPNAQEIGNWISRNKRRSVFIEIHNKRPVPVCHYIYGLGQFLKIFEEGEPFILRSTFESHRIEYNRKWWNDSFETPQFWTTFITKLSEEKMLPALVFNFSSDKIENYAKMATEIDLLSPSEKVYVIDFFNKAINKLPTEDQKLPQILMMKELIEKGIGIHYGGIIPILREVIEILLADGFLKVVFCTSSFEMGINVPVRTCCFTTIDKFNGEQLATLTHDEYMQMSGRAGRRGLDTIGYSLILAGEEFFEFERIQRLFFESSEKTKSQFHIDFDMIFNSIRKGMHMVDIMNQSLLANTEHERNENIKEKNNELHSKLIELPPIKNCDKMNQIISNDIEEIESNSPIHDFVETVEKLNELNIQIISIDLNQFLNHLNEGVIVLFSNKNLFQIGIIESIQNNNFDKDDVDIPLIITLFFSNGVKYIVKNMIDLNCIHILTSPLKNILTENEEKIKKNLCDFSVDKFEPYNILFNKTDSKFIKISNDHHQQLLKLLSNSPCFKCDQIGIHYETSQKMRQIRSEINSLLTSFNDNKSNLSEDLIDNHFNMLREMSYIKGEKDHEVLDQKGEVAVDLNYADKIIATEMLYNHVFDDCKPDEIAALCSCLVSDRRGSWQSAKNSNSKLLKKLDEMLIVLDSIVEKMKQNEIRFDLKKYTARNMNPAVMFIVYAWANGKSFAEIMRDESRIKDGYMLYIISKDFKLLENLHDAAMKIGFVDLAGKFESAAKLIERYKIFSGSLYFDDDD